MTKFLQVCLCAMLLFGPNAFANTTKLSSNYETPSPSTIQRVRIDFVTPLGFTRHLLLAFTSNNAASDSVDYGYDASNIENLPDDLNWLIEEGRYVIQGVGAFEETKSYPLGMFLSNSGSVKIKLDRLENFESAIDVFIYDKEEDSYHKISEFDFDTEMEAGDYTERFYITFSAENANSQQAGILSDGDHNEDEFTISYQKNIQTLSIEKPAAINTMDVSLFDINGKILLSKLSVIESKLPLRVTRFNHQVLILRITSESANFTKKVLLK